jgi:hypothetical protein
MKAAFVFALFNFLALGHGVEAAVKEGGVVQLEESPGREFAESILADLHDITRKHGLPANHPELLLDGIQALVTKLRSADHQLALAPSVPAGLQEKLPNTKVQPTAVSAGALDQSDDEVPAVYRNVPEVRSRLQAIREAVAEIKAGGPIVLDAADRHHCIRCKLPDGWKYIPVTSVRPKIVLAKGSFVFKANAYGHDCEGGFKHNLQDLVGTLQFAELGGGPSPETRVDDLILLASPLFQYQMQVINTPP